MLIIKNFRIFINNMEVVKGIDLTIKLGEIHAVMGPNGAGKTTLAMGLMGHPSYNIKYQISNIKYQIDGKDMSNLLPEERAKSGLFISFQQPVEISGVSFLSFLRTAYKQLHPDEKISLTEFKSRVKEAFVSVGLAGDMMQRSINENLSGGEKKRAEIAQLLVLRPRFAVLDEVDSGLDVDSLRIAAKAILSAVKKYGIGVLVITHYQRILHYLKPHYVHVLIDGRIKKSDGIQLVRTIEENGYAAI